MCIRYFLFLVITIAYAKSCRNVLGDKNEEFERLKKGYDSWKQLSHPYYKEQNFDPDKHNITKAYEEAEEFDFIIIGAGASGAIVASRLSEVKHWKVLLVEAGPEENDLVDMPGTYPFLLYTEYDWGYKTVPQNYTCFGAPNRQCIARFGKGAGGGTLVNGFYYTHGHPEDYNKWAELKNDGWSWNDVLPYLKKPENTNDIKFDDWKYHGRGGKLFIEDFPYYTNLTHYILEAAKELGKPIGDYNGPNQLVYGIPYGTIHNGKRFSVASGYLNKRIRKRFNLSVRTQSQAIRIITNKTLVRAEGIEYLQKGTLKVAKARKEVILSAGAANTPQLLMLSGIGPAEHLTEIGIETLVDLPVGYNLNNHLSYWGTAFTFSKTVVSPYTLEEAIKGYINCRGPFTNIGLDAVGYYKSKLTDTNSERPDIEFQFSTRSGGITNWSRANETNLVIQVNIMHPLSRGRVTLRDKDPLHYPLIDLGYLSNSTDIDLILEGIHHTLVLMNTTTMQALGPKLIPQNIPACKHLSGDQYWRCTIKYSTTSLSHYCGSAKMGPKSDKGAVVDNLLRVHGIKNLRVADASILPVTISGHTMSPCNMIGEKAAAIIKSTWK